MRINNPGWVPPLSITGAQIATASVQGNKLVSNAVYNNVIQALGRMKLIYATATFTAPKTGDYLLTMIGGGGGGGGSASNLAGDSSSGGWGGGMGEINWFVLSLTGGLVYTGYPGNGSGGGGGGVSGSTSADAGGVGQQTAFADPGGTLIAKVLGGWGGLGGQMSSGANIRDMIGTIGNGPGGGNAGQSGIAGYAGQAGGDATSFGGAGGGAAGNNAIATATDGSPGGSGYQGCIIIQW